MFFCNHSQNYITTRKERKKNSSENEIKQRSKVAHLLAKSILAPCLPYGRSAKNLLRHNVADGRKGAK